MIICRTQSELRQKLLVDITTQVDKVTSPLIKDILNKHIDQNIYNAYEPKLNGWGYASGEKWIRQTYPRRKDIGQKLKSNVDSSEGTIVVTTTETANTSRYSSSWMDNFMQTDGAFFLLLERTNPGLWSGGFSRPVVPLAQAEINNSSAIRSSIQSVLDSMSCL